MLYRIYLCSTGHILHRTYLCYIGHDYRTFMLYRAQVLSDVFVLLDTHIGHVYGISDALIGHIYVLQGP